MEWSFKEKSAWISLISTLCIFGYYFAALFGWIGSGPLDVSSSIGLLGQAVVLSIVVEALFHAMLAATNRKAAELGADERDQNFEYKANQLGYSVLVVTVFIVLGHMVSAEVNPDFAQSVKNATGDIPLFVAHVLMLGFILSEISRFALQIFYYRRGY